jgi:peptidoglycan hydrolase FlgJ
MLHATMDAGTLNPSVFDANSLAALKRQTRSNDPAALKATAQQFEAMFLQIVLKSMRDATPKDGMFDSEQTRMYESLLDQQLGQVIATKGGGTGLAAMIEKQLTRAAATVVEPERSLPLKPATEPHPIGAPVQALPLHKDAAPSHPLTPPVTAPASSAAPSSATRDFVTKIWPHAAAAAQATGVPAAFLVGQAALETGWGRAELRQVDGQPSYNVFGIKAGREWTGPTVAATTTEYVNGMTQQRVERFRAYGSYAEAFADYAKLLGTGTRYSGVVGATDASTFARGLQRAGYATDPAYADKLTRIIGGQTLRAALAV